jgi:hypothetical protein
MKCWVQTIFEASCLHHDYVLTHHSILPGFHYSGWKALGLESCAFRQVHYALCPLPYASWILTPGSLFSASRKGKRR